MLNRIKTAFVLTLGKVSGRRAAVQQSGGWFGRQGSFLAVLLFHQASLERLATAGERAARPRQLPQPTGRRVLVRRSFVAPRLRGAAQVAPHPGGQRQSQELGHTDAPDARLGVPVRRLQLRRVRPDVPLRPGDPAPLAGSAAARPHDLRGAQEAHQRAAKVLFRRARSRRFSWFELSSPIRLYIVWQSCLYLLSLAHRCAPRKHWVNSKKRPLFVFTARVLVGSFRGETLELWHSARAFGAPKWVWVSREPGMLHCHDIHGRVTSEAVSYD